MTEQEQATDAVVDPGEDTDGYVVPENPHYDDVDVPAALERETDDGKGGAVVPKTDFESYTDPEADVKES